jgi:hypothetical protein
MKKHVIIATGAALLSTSAFATKARMTALGQDGDRGSQYIQDSRNTFRNAAHVNNMNNYVVTEWGNGASAQQYEGGFFRSTGSLAYGLYLGSDRHSGLGVYNDIAANEFRPAQAAYRPGNQIDLFLGGDAGFQWGARLGYMGGEDKTGDTVNAITYENIKRNAMNVGFGVLAGDLSAYLDLNIGDKTELTDPVEANVEQKGKLGLNIGGAYSMQNLTFHADIKTRKAETTVVGNPVTRELKHTGITVGVAQTHEISSTAMVFVATDFTSAKWEDSNGPGSAAKYQENNLVVRFGFETDATSWLTWRGALSQSVFVASEKLSGTWNNNALGGKQAYNNESTNVTAGASLTFGKLVVDGSIGAGGNLNLDQALANVAVSYWF